MASNVEIDHVPSTVAGLNGAWIVRITLTRSNGDHVYTGKGSTLDGAAADAAGKVAINDGVAAA